jgi:DNA-binding FrmR family transcriptional regulator
MWKGGFMDETQVIKQLRRIEGQVRGIIGMIEGSRGLVPTVQQFSAIQASLDTSLRNYVSCFLNEEGEQIVLTREQVKYILSLISRK